MKPILRTLIIEDAEDDAQLLRRQLIQGGYDPQSCCVDTAPALDAALENQEWDIIFSDYSMPQFNGMHALAMVRERGIQTPFIFLSGTIGEDTAVAAIRAGAQDYIMKGNPKRLLPAVERELREAQLRRERQQAEEELQLLQSITQVASASGDALAALTVTLAKVCETTHWPFAQAWIPRADGAAIECSPAWYGRGADWEPFRTASAGAALAPGEDLPGRVWSTRKPVWLVDLKSDCGDARRACAKEIGVQATLGVPVLAGDRALAVLEFCLREPRAEDARLVKLIGAVAEQLGSVLRRKHAEERLHYLAQHDALTALPNRVLFIDRLRQAIHEAKRHGRVVGVVTLDLDRFKHINDSLGHGIGDLLIRAAADRLGECVREGDTVARLAGDEFAILLNDMGRPDHAAQVAKKILSNLAQPFDIAGQRLFTSGSLGLAMYPADDTDVDALLHNADIAMHRAKATGGNAYTFYSADMAVKAHARLALENDVRRALEQGEFLLHYQPMIDLKTGHIEALETLVRWQHPQQGLRAPSEFIPLTEDCGLVTSIGEWVLRNALEQYQAYFGGPSGLRLAVNLSVRQFQQPDLPEMIGAMLRRTGFDPACLEFEITESILMQDVEAAVATMRTLNDQGVQFSIDDFGTGYSSLAYLKRLPISRVKIDQSFVHDLPIDANDCAIVSAIISMAHDLGLRVIAEGVTSAQQLAFLRDRGCDAAQGYYISPPLAAPETAFLLKCGITRA